MWFAPAVFKTWMCEREKPSPLKKKKEIGQLRSNLPVWAKGADKEWTLQIHLCSCASTLLSSTRSNLEPQAIFGYNIYTHWSLSICLALFQNCGSQCTMHSEFEATTIIKTSFEMGYWASLLLNIWNCWMTGALSAAAGLEPELTNLNSSTGSLSVTVALH